MPTCRVLIAEAYRALKVLAPGDDPEADELAAGLEAVQNLVLDLHAARIPMVDVDVTADYTASENQRVRIQAGAVIEVTLPNAVAFTGYVNPDDYGFSLSLTAQPPTGSTAAADGLSLRQPRDGARIEVVGTLTGLYVYRADINAWVDATGLTLDSEMPINARDASHFGALLAERLADSTPDAQITPTLARRIAHGNGAMMLRLGVPRDPVLADYL